ncbi:TPA: helix-turn-helix domain-containing protein [bacterium]|nr:helix-turn-helix domain-containing protein [bacterium]
MSEIKSDFQNYMESIQTVSGMEICIYDLTYFTYKVDGLYIDLSFRSHNSPICMLTKLSKKRHRDCIKTEHNRLILASNSGGNFLIDTCHCGLADIIVPISIGSQLVGGIFLGQVFLEDYPGDSLYREYLAGYDDVALEDILREVRDVPVKTYKELLSWKDVCRLASSYIEEKVKLYEFKKTRDDRSYYISLTDMLPTLSEPMQKAMNIIIKRVNKGINLEQVASSVGYSPSQFSRKFKRETGMTFSKCLKRLRIELAQYLLKDMNRGICEVAYEVGYSDVPSFLRAFKEETGMTPSKWLLYHVPIKTHTREEFSI